MFTANADYKYTVGRGYIALPVDLERAQYIRDCYKNNQVCILTEEGGFLTRLPISPEILNFIEFPQTPKELGTCIIYAVDEQTKLPYIVSRFANREEIGDNREGRFSFRRKSIDGKYVEISGSVNENAISMVIDSGGEEGSFDIKIFNTNQNSALNIDVAGSVNIQATGTVTASSEQEIVHQAGPNQEAKYVMKDGIHNVYGDKVIVNDGQDPMVLGNELKTFLGNFIDAVAAITTNTAIGLQPIVNKEDVKKLKDQLDSILSSQGFLKQ